MHIRPATFYEILNLIKQIKSKETCGYDNIDLKVVILLYSHGNCCPVLDQLCNLCFENKIFLCCLKIAKIVVYLLLKAR